MAEIHSARPSLYGLETHLVTMQRMIEEYQPRAVILDPITNLIVVGSIVEVRLILTRIIDWLRLKGITSMYTSLTSGGDDLEQTELGISSLMDTWLLLRDIESNGERNRGLFVIKSRGMAHSNQIREFLITDSGVELVDVYLGPGGVLTGTSRMVQEAKEKAAALERLQEIERRKNTLDRKRQAVEAQIEALRNELAAEEEEARRFVQQEEAVARVLREDRDSIARYRKEGNHGV